MYPVRITHPDFPYLTLRTEDGAEYRMEKTGADTYSVADRFPQKMKAFVIAPKVGENGNELVFGYENSQVKIGAESAIPFSSSRGGKFAVELNTRTFAASPLLSSETQRPGAGVGRREHRPHRHGPVAGADHHPRGFLKLR